MGVAFKRNQAILDRVSVVLNAPRFPENIGSTARAMWNMGVSSLIVVNPLHWDEEAMQRLATSGAARVLRDLVVHRTLEEALAPFGHVVGTTARSGGLRRPLLSPRNAAIRIADLAGSNRIAVLLGPEDRGLTNRELRFCHMLVRIPTAEFSSLNVAQAALIVCYEIFLATMAPREEADPQQRATAGELERMYGRLQETLVDIGMVSSDHPEHQMMKIRQTLSRVGLMSQDVQLVLGLCRQIAWYGDMRARRASKSRLENRSEDDER